MSDEGNKCLDCGKPTGSPRNHFCPPCRLNFGKKVIHEAKADDHVNHPTYYTDNPKGIELIDMIGHLSFPKGAAIKYIYRSGKKDPTKSIEDLQKAKWFIDHMIKELQDEKDLHDAR